MQIKESEGREGQRRGSAGSPFLFFGPSRSILPLIMVWCCTESCMAAVLVEQGRVYCRTSAGSPFFFFGSSAAHDASDA